MKFWLVIIWLTLGPDAAPSAQMSSILVDSLQECVAMGNAMIEMGGLPACLPAKPPGQPI